MIEDAALEIAWAYRSEFQKPLTHVVMGLRSFARTEGGPDVVVAQRLKRMPRIVEKLRRSRRNNLSRMQDIGGCRAILPDVATVDAVHRRIKMRKWTLLREDDYNADPKPTGYRGVHIVVEKFGRPIEIQLRTPWQNQWASSVEKLDQRHRFGLKDGHGPEEVLRLLERSAYALDSVNRGNQMSGEFDEEFAALRAAAQPYLIDKDA